MFWPNTQRNSWENPSSPVPWQAQVPSCQNGDQTQVASVSSVHATTTVSGWQFYVGYSIHRSNVINYLKQFADRTWFIQFVLLLINYGENLKNQIKVQFIYNCQHLEIFHFEMFCCGLEPGIPSLVRCLSNQARRIRYVSGMQTNIIPLKIHYFKLETCHRYKEIDILVFDFFFLNMDHQ